MIFIIPGNPGIAEYYQDLALSLSRNKYKSGQFTSKNSGGSGVHILSYSSFQRNAPLNVRSISDEAKYLENEILNRIATEPHPPNQVIVIGHSIGSWILQEILHRNPDLVDRAFFLFPFLARDRISPKQKFIHRMLQTPGLEKLVLIKYRLFGYLPLSWKKKSIAGFIKSMTESAKHWTEEYFLKALHIPRSVIQLARTEFETLPTELEWQKLQKIQNKSIFIFNPQDIWAPMSHYTAIREKLPGTKTLLLNDIPHDFCVYPHSNKRIAEVIQNFLNRPET